MKEIIGYSAYLIACTAFSILINGLFLKFSKTLGMRNIDESLIRWGSKTKPAFGGISFYIIFLFSIAVYSVVAEQKSALGNIQFLGLLGAVTLGFIVGLADDAYNTKPYLKFSAQLTCGLLLTATGTYIKLFEDPILNYFITVFWVIGIMNSINMLDNMDAITSITSLFIVVAALITIVFSGSVDKVHFLILLGTLSALIGFLFFNWNPSKMYMGDTGSQFLGVLLAAISIIYFWNTPFDGEYKLWSKQIMITVTIFIIPIVDTTTVVIKRLRRGKSPFVGGRDHTTHHLSYLGFSDRKVAYILGSISLVSTLTVAYIQYFQIWTSLHVFFLIIYFLFVFGTLFYISVTSKPHEK